VNQDIQGVLEPWGLGGSLANVFDPPAWCGAAKTLCAGAWRPPPLVEKLLSGDELGECLCGRAFVASQVVLLGDNW
jgi:hypothetical protein